jgi:hypothetical protein
MGAAVYGAGRPSWPRGDYALTMPKIAQYSSAASSATTGNVITHAAAIFSSSERLTGCWRQTFFSRLRS